MNLGNRDLFELWRLLLATVCGIYATVVTVRSVMGWLLYLSGSDRVSRLMRTYALVHLLRLRWRRFSRDLLAIGAYLVIIGWLLYEHGHGNG